MQFIQIGKEKTIFFLCLIPLTIITYTLFQPALSSLFLLDDHHNLAGLTAMENGLQIDTIRDYLLQASAGPGGRPISLLTFALQASHWPHDPAAFKFVNLILHLINGTLISILVTAVLLQFNTQRSTAYFMGLLATAFWLLHPIQVSSVLYVIQRMNQLAVLFTLIGIGVYLLGRTHLAQGRITSGFWIMSTGVVLFGCLAVLSKENGILLPLYILVLEATLLPKLKAVRGWATWKALFLWAPLIAIFGYLAVELNTGMLNGYQLRDFNLTERLLTESRIVFNYLFKSTLIAPGSYGLFQDDFPISRSLLHPLSTLIAVIALPTLIVSTFLFRKRYPVLAFAVLWFFGGHLLESTVIPLELYFDHRNYLPMLGPLILVAYLAITGLEKIHHRGTQALATIAIALWIGFSSWSSAQEIQLWSNPVRQAAVWAHQHPHSKRAQVHAMGIADSTNNPQAAESIGRKLLDRHPDDTTLASMALYLQCKYDNIEILPIGIAVQRFSLGKRNGASPTNISRLFSEAINSRCSRYSDQQFFSLANALISNSNFQSNRAEIYRLRGQLHASRGDQVIAISDLEQSLTYRANTRTALILTAWAVERGDRINANRYLSKAVASATTTKSRILYKDSFEFAAKQISKLE